MEQILSQIQACIADGEMEEALQKMQTSFSISESELLNDVLLIRGQLKKLRSDRRRGIIDYQTETLRHNQIMNSILGLVDELKKDPEIIQRLHQVETTLKQSIREKALVGMPSPQSEVLFQRIAFAKEKQLQLKALWIADHPEINRREQDLLKTFGVQSITANSSEEASGLITQHTFDLMISDIARGGKSNEGIRFHRELVSKLGNKLPTIFYILRLDPTRGVPPYSFGITNRPDELIHLVLDIIVRKY